MGRIWTNGSGLALNAANLNALENDLGRSVKPWTPNTSYGAGQAVLSPEGAVVTANSTHTSGASYTAANWADIGAQRIGEALTYWDDFERADGPVGSSAPSGQAYDLTGAGAPLISSGRLVASAVGSAYAGFQLGQTARRIAVKFAILTTGGTTSAVAIVLGQGTSTTALISDSAHFIVQRDKWSFQYRSGGATTTVREGYFATQLANAATHLWEVAIDDDGTVTFLLDGAFLDSCNDPTITSRLGSYAYIEPTKQASGGDEAQILEAWAFTPLAQTFPASAKGRGSRGWLARAFAAITGDSPAMAGIDLVARKGLAQMVRIGRSLSGNLPAVVFNETADLYLVGSAPGSLRTSASIYSQAGGTSQVIVGGVSGGPGIALGSTGDVILRRIAANVLATGTANGFRPGVVTTATRPTAASMGAGTVLYDTTIGKPIWSDGTTWKDSAGTAV